MGNTVNPGANGAENALPHLPIDGVARYPGREQLPAGDVPRLPRCEPLDGTPRQRFGESTAHSAVNPPNLGDAPPRRAGDRGPATGSPGALAFAGVEAEQVLRRPVPGRLYPWVRRASWFELGLFATLIAFWLLPGFDSETMVFGWAHGLGFIALAILIWIAVLRHEAPYTLLAATLTPVGPLGSVIAIEWQDRRPDRSAPQAPASPT